MCIPFCVFDIFISMKYTKEKLEILTKESFSIREVMLKLGLKEAGGSHYHIKKLITNFGIDITHFRGCLWSKGKTILSDSRIKGKYSLDEMLTTDSPVGNDRLKRLLLTENIIEYKCVGINCGNDGNWNGNKLILELDHINGVHNDNRLENLRFLCPNCHSQTPNFRKKKNTGKKNLTNE